MKIKISVIVFILITAMLVSCGKKSSEEPENSDDSGEYVNIYFHDNTGIVIKSDKISKNSNVESPPSEVLADGFVFKEWDKSLAGIGEDTHFNPVFVDIRKENNVVFVPSAYSKDGDTVSVTVQIGGQVSFSCLELELTYEESLTFSEIKEVDADAVCHYDEENKKIYFAMATSKNITSGVDLFTITFDVGTESAEIKININDIACFTEKGELVSASYDKINGKIHTN